MSSPVIMSEVHCLIESLMAINIYFSLNSPFIFFCVFVLVVGLFLLLNYRSSSGIRETISLSVIGILWFYRFSLIKILCSHEMPARECGLRAPLEGSSLLISPFFT